MFESSKYAEDLTNVPCTWTTLLLDSTLDMISLQYTWQLLHSHYTRPTSL